MIVNICREMSAEETRTTAGGGRTARSFTAREDLVQALVSLGVTRNAATRVLNELSIDCCYFYVLTVINVLSSSVASSQTKILG